MIGRTTCLAIAICVTAASLATPIPPALARTCDENAFGNQVDQTSKALNTLNATSEKRILAKLKQLQTRSGNRTGFPLAQFQSDPKIVAYDRQIEDLLGDVDDLGNLTGNNKPTCQRLVQLTGKSKRLIAVMKRKLAYLDSTIDARLNAPAQTTAASKSTTKPKAAAKSTTQVDKFPKAKPAKQKLATKPVSAKQQAPDTAQDWSRTTQTAVNTQLPPPTSILPPIRGPRSTSFSIEEIRQVGRGFFGTISVGLANAINYTFQKAGKPTGYILGKEGGGAFLAGLRYGKGDLVTKLHGQQKIFWRGPSVGYDVGATGSRTMFLVYNLKEPNQLHKRFSAIDGSAYLAAGIGITFLTDGDIVLAPIRSGVGLRLGASIGYLKLSARSSWNPF